MKVTTIGMSQMLVTHRNELMLQVRGRDVGFQTTKEGEFWRILLPGIYTMEVFAEGFAPREVQFAIVEQNPTMLNVTLYPVRFDKGTSVVSPNH